jgi:signal transduction histidine kinase
MTTLSQPPASEAGAATSSTTEAEVAISSQAEMPPPWLKPLVAAVVLLFALLSLLELAIAYVGRTMPALHFVAGPIAIGLLVIIWFAELGGVRWSLLAFATLVTVPNLWLAAIGHSQLNLLFLVPAVAWVTYRGGRTVGRVALALNLAVVGAGALVDLAHGQLALGSRIPWAVGLILAWGATRALVFQQRLAAELRATQRDLTWRVTENQRLRAAAERRLRDVEALYRADEALYGALRTERVLQALVNVVAEVVAADHSAVLTWDEGRERLVVAASHGWARAGAADAPVPRSPVADGATESILGGATEGMLRGALGQVLRDRRPLAIEDIASAEESGVTRQAPAAAGVGALLLVPILIDNVDERVLGVLVVGYCQPRRFADDEQRLFVALAQRTTLALENARLYEQARQTALLEERQRLARELHDAVTQTLFASSLIADVLPRLWERDLEEGRRRLAELRELTRGALAEMRTLLYELRPAALAETPLGDLLRQLVDATIGQARLPVSLSVEGQRALPPDVQVALYRIAQETLNNVAKHAMASRAEVSLIYRADGVELCLRDDGQGFDLSQIPPGHLGVGILRERALTIGAGLEIASRPGGGTRLTVSWPRSG